MGHSSSAVQTAVSMRRRCILIAVLMAIAAPTAFAQKPGQSAADRLQRLIELNDQRPTAAADDWTSPEEFNELYVWLGRVLDELDEIVTTSERTLDKKFNANQARTPSTPSHLTLKDIDDHNDGPEMSELDPHVMQEDDGTLFLGDVLHGQQPVTSTINGLDAMVDNEKFIPASKPINDAISLDGSQIGGPSYGSSERVGRFVKPFVNTWYFDWPWVAKDGQNMFFWVIGPPVGAAGVLALGFFVLVNRPIPRRR